MKVILLRDVAKIGRRFEVKEVPTGHALNFLIPRKYAEPATPEALRRLTGELAKRTSLTREHDASFAQAVEALSHTPITISAEANAQGHLFRAIHESDIAAAIERMGFSIAPTEIVLHGVLKQLGDHTITLRAGTHEGTATVHITGT